jgi:hypothetical protein
MNNPQVPDVPRPAETGTMFGRVPRRALLERVGLSPVACALAALMKEDRAGAYADPQSALPSDAGLPALHHGARARRMVFLNMSGGPSQLDLFDPKPTLVRHDGRLAPAELTTGEKFAQLSGTPLLMASPYRFARRGDAGLSFSELLPEMARESDRWTMIRSMTTDVVNHDPAQLLLATGDAEPGRPSLGAWLSYGLGRLTDELPSFVVLTSGTGQPLGAHCWSSGFLPTRHQGVPFRSQGDPAHFVADPAWMPRESRRASLSALADLNRVELRRTGDPEIETRIQAYETAFRMQASVPELMSLAGESAATLAEYGAVPGRPSFGLNCLLARRLLERGVRFVQVYHRDWDHHGLPETGGIDDRLPERCREADGPTAALLGDLARRGLLDDTIVVWGGEFGRTPIRQHHARSRALGRDHHRRAFTVLVAGGGFRAGHQHGATDEFGFHVAEDPVHVHDLQATLLDCLGIDHERLTFRRQGRDFRLTDTAGKVVRALLA